MSRRYFYYLFRFYYRFKCRFLDRFTRAGFLVAGGAVLAAIIGIDTRQTVAYQAFTFLLFLLCLSILFSLVFRVRLKAYRILPRFATAGESVTYTLVVQNRSAKIQKGLAVQEDFGDVLPDLEEFMQAQEPGEEKRNIIDRLFGYYRWSWVLQQKRPVVIETRNINDLAPMDEAAVSIEMVPSRRGILQLAGITIVRPDPLGLFNARFRIALRESLLVLPKRYQLPDHDLPGRRRYQSGGVALASSVGDSEEFVSLRDYRPGDPLRKIHWKSWAKLDKPIVKEYQDEFFVRHALIMDTFVADPFSERFEAAVSLAASYVCSLYTQESLLDLMFVGLETYCFTAGRGLAHTDRMLEILASVTPCRNKTIRSLTPIIISRASMLSGCICVFLCWDKARRELVNTLHALDVPLVVMVLDKTDTPEDPSRKKEPPSGNVLSFRRLTVGRIQEGLLQS